MSYLIDSSVWIRHLKSKDEDLIQYLHDDKVLLHPFILGELSLGHMRKRSEIIELLNYLPMITQATHVEVMEFVKIHKLWGRGIGWIDCHLLTSTKISGSRIYTYDKALKKIAKELDLI